MKKFWTKWRSFILIVLALILFTLFFQPLKFKIYEIFNISDAWESRYSLAKLIWQHLVVVFFSSLLALGVGITLGVFGLNTRLKEFHILIDKSVYLLQMIPTLAVLTITAPLLGLGTKTAVVALVICAMLPIYTSVISGVKGVPQDVIEVAKGLGMPTKNIYKEIIIPLAMPVIIAGFRTALIINVSAATLAARIGAGGLGILLLNAMKTGKTMTIVEGTIPVCLLALAIDVFLKNIEEMFYAHREE